MTSQADFKRRVRERMDRTGERYMTARAHLLRTRAEDEPAADAHPVGGTQADVAAAANAVARLGVSGPTGEPFDEVDLYGLAGGIGFMHAVFVYEDFGPTMTVTTRTVSMPDPFVEEGLSRAGVEVETVTTGSATLAATRLEEALEAGHPVLCSVESAAMPYLGGDARMMGAGPRVVGVIGRDGDHLLVDDRAVSPFRVPAASLAAARNVVKRNAHRSLVLAGAVPGHDWVAAVRGALARTVAGYDESPARSFVKNVGTAGLHTWAARLTATDAKGWARVFAEPAHLHYGLRRVVECIEHELTSPAAGRPMFARWLERAAGVTGLRLQPLADSARESAEHWRSVARLATEVDPSVEQAVGVLERSIALLDEHGDEGVAEAQDLRAGLDGLRASCRVGGADAGEVLGAMATHVTAIAEIERGLLDGLAAALG